jgi:hypothetical protein
MNPSTATAPAPTTDQVPTVLSKALLAGGATAGPLFVASIVVQAATRDGFDARRHPLSMLSLGEYGWIQIITFIVAGLLAVGGAIGLRRVLHPGRGSTWGPLLIGAYGLGLVWGGIFVTDPAEGFPPGTPDGPPEMTWHGTLHNFSPTVTALALIAACLVFARRFAGIGRRGWMVYCLVSPVLYLSLGFAAFPAEDFRWLLAGGAIIWLWPSALALRQLAQR